LIEVVVYRSEPDALRPGIGVCCFDYSTKGLHFLWQIKIICDGIKTVFL
jgi:hypothetical protein